MKNVTCRAVGAMSGIVSIGILSSAIADDARLRPWTVSAGADMVSAYFFRGIAQENQGVIVQPWGALSYALSSGDGPISNMSLTGTAWNSFQTGPSRDAGDPEGWYELDLSVALSATIYENFTLAIGYTAYTSPAGAFDSIQEVNLALSWDDSKLLKAFALHPHAVVACEFDDQADAGNTAFVSTGTSEGIYAELGIAPQIPLGKETLNLVLPATVGLSLHNYYENADGHDNTFGYFDLGAELVSTLSSAKYDVTFRIGPHGIWLGDTAAEMGSGVTGGDDFFVYLRGGVSISF